MLASPREELGKKAMEKETRLRAKRQIRVNQPRYELIHETKVVDMLERVQRTKTIFDQKAFVMPFIKSGPPRRKSLNFLKPT